MGSRKRSDWTDSSWAGFADWGRRLELRAGAIRGLLDQRGSGFGGGVLLGLEGRQGVAVMAELKLASIGE